jgi:hypothetical protein
MKSVIRAFEVLLWSALLLCGSSCTIPWGNLPPTTYRGKVVHDELGTGIANATITASRPCVRSSLWPMVRPEVLATTKSDAHGNFLMTTRTGYATQIVTRSRDQKLSGFFEPSRKHRDTIELRVSATLTGVCYRTKGDKYVDPESSSSKVADAAIRHLVKYISAHPDALLKSLKQYNKQGIISEEALSVFKSVPDHYFGPQSLVEYVWGRQALLLPDQSTTIRFVPQREKWLTP